MALTKIDDRGLKTPIDLLDNEKIRFGTGNDSEFVHDGTNTKWVTTNGNIRLLDDAIEFWNRAGNEPIAKFDANGSCELYHDDSKKFETTADGVTIGGDSGITGNWDLEVYNGSGVAYGILAGTSGSWLELRDTGSSELLEIRAGGGGSSIRDKGTGDLNISGTIVRLQSSGEETLARGVEDGAFELYYDNSKKLETTSNGVQVSSGATDAHLTIRGGATDGRATLTFISDDAAANSDTWRLHNDANNDFYLQNYSAGSWGTNLKTLGGGAVELYHNDIKTFNTASSGIEIRGPESGNCEFYMYADEGDDNADLWKFVADTGGDFTTQNKASGSWAEKLRITSGGKVKISSHGTNDLRSLAVLGPKSQIQWGTAEDVGGFLMSEGNGQFRISGGSYYNGSAWVAKHSGSAMLGTDGDGDLNFFTNDSLTSGNTFTPSSRVTLKANGHFFVGSNNGAFGNAGTQFASFRTNQANVYITTFRNEHDQGRGLLVASGEAGDAGPHRSIFFEADDGSSLGSITHNGSASAFNTSSDYRLKQDIVSITDGITQIKKLTPRRFKWKNNTSLPVSDGFIAHEIQESGAINNIVVGAKDEKDGDGKDEYQTVDYAKLTPLLTAALKEAIAKIETLETKVAALEAA